MEWYDVAEGGFWSASNMRIVLFSESWGMLLVGKHRPQRKTTHPTELVVIVSLGQ